jgi:hypothetical protein
MDGVGGGATRTPSDGPSANSPAAAEQDELRAHPLILSELVATIGERWSAWDAAREEARVALHR